MAVQRSARDASRKLPESERRARGRATRRKMLDALKSELQTRSIRDIKVVNIAESAGVTPAAFYQYFVDLDDAILSLADDMVTDARGLIDLMTGDWQNNADQITNRMVEGFLQFWQKHEAVLRVIELAIDERDSRYNRLRAAMFAESTVALSFVIGNFKDAGVQPDDVEPRALAAALLAVLIHVSSRLWLYEEWGLRSEDIQRSIADILRTMVTRADLRAPAAATRAPRNNKLAASTARPA
jgi:AcrR family transcriptional regulator